MTPNKYGSLWAAISGPLGRSARPARPLTPAELSADAAAPASPPLRREVSDFSDEEIRAELARRNNTGQPSTQD